MSATQSILAVDSHTGGEPTRLVIQGGPDLGNGPVSEQLEVFRDQHDSFRSAVVNEPRGSDVLVGALLCAPQNTKCDIGLIFFNNVGFLGMCGHGTIGAVATLASLGRLKPGLVRIETSVGIVTASLLPDGSVAIENVPSCRKSRRIKITVPGIGPVQGDVAWGGNWFFLVDSAELKECPALTLENAESLTQLSWRLRQAVNTQGHPEVDHVELFGPAKSASNDSRNFVLCPGKAFDRSPCGTGTSAKLACLAADGQLAEHEPWIQESILGSTFAGSYRWLDRSHGIVAPTIRGSAHVTSKLELILDPSDPFRWGIRPE